MLREPDCRFYLILIALLNKLSHNSIHPYSRETHFTRTRWGSWLIHRATSRKFAGSIPDSVIGIFHWHNPSGRTVALWSTQPLTEMSTRNISWGVKAGGEKGWQPYHLHVPIVLKFESLNILEPSGPVQGYNGTAYHEIHGHTTHNNRPLSLRSLKLTWTVLVNLIRLLHVNNAALFNRKLFYTR